MLGALIRILPTLWPFILEILGIKANKTRGGAKPSGVRRVLLFCLILFILLAGVVYDITWKLIVENQKLVISASENAAVVKESKMRLEVLEAELRVLKEDHIASEREIAAAKAKLDFAVIERQRLEVELKELRSAHSR